MWKSIVLCISLFGGAAMGLSVGARFVEPAALPAAAAIGLCLIGVVLILAAPTAGEAIETLAGEQRQAGEGTTVVTAQGAEMEPVEVPTVAAVANRTPALPFEAINP
jgi:hypothetical protein